ncbi:hypothetical protein [uncultured Sphingomonas sp.]|uniref:hypothetical protein n=1 Tax=uncultured Sphingomonas sp. TaxID=158754 RepID=UPI00374793AF
MAQTFTHDGVVYEDLGDGNVRAIGYAAAPTMPQGFTIGSPNPVKQQTEALQLDKLRGDIARQPAMTDAELRGKQLDNQKKERELGAQPTVNLTAKERADAIAGYKSGLSVERLVADLERLYAEGPGSTSGIRGLQDYLPTEINQRFDTAGNAARGNVGTALGFTGGQLNTATEAAQSVGPYLPKASDRDGTIRDKIARLKQLAEDAKARSIQILGGVPDENGHVTPVGADAPAQRKPIPGAIATGRFEAATGANRQERDPVASAIIDRMVRQGSPLDTINTTLANLGYNPVEQKSYDAVRAHFKANPNFQGSYGDATRTVENSMWEKASSSPFAAASVGITNGLTGGATDELFGLGRAAFTGMPVGQAIAEANASKNALAEANWKSSLAGNLVGGGLGFLGAGAGARALGLGARFSPYLGSAAYGAASGALENNDNRLLGAGFGAVTGLAGQKLGDLAAKGIGAAIRTQPGQAATNAVRTYFGRAPLPSAAPLNAADTIAANTINRIGADNIRTPLTEAADLGIPMALVDTNPALRELGGAAVRRSPAASQIAEDALLPRNRGQYDRFVNSVERDLGPSVNIPQMSEDLTRQAQAAAAPLYEQAYRQPVTSTPELESLLNTPFGRSATGRARTIAANERRNPMEMGFVQDADGTVRLNPAPTQQIDAVARARADLDAAQAAYRDARNSPAGSLDSARTRVENAREGLRQAEASFNSAPRAGEAMRQPGYTTQTLDYVKRGMDDVLEQYRNPITNRLNLDEAGRAQNGVKNNLLSELDRLNPTYAQARGVYQGPVASRDALIRGQDAYGLPTDQLAVQVGQQTPEHLGQMRLGFQDSLLKRAAGVRDNANPFEATLGTPAMRARLDTLYDSNANVPRLLRTRDIEGGLQQTTNAILSNSRTARNQIADANFSTNPLLEGSLHAGAALATGGASLPGTAARVAGTWARDRLALGLGKQAEAKAEALAPFLFDTNPHAALSSVDDLMGRYVDWQALVEASRPKRLGMMFNGALINSGNRLASGQ